VKVVTVFPENGKCRSTLCFEINFMEACIVCLLKVLSGKNIVKVVTVFQKMGNANQHYALKLILWRHV